MVNRPRNIQPPLRVSEVAQRMGVADRTVRQWITVGLRGKKLKAKRAGESGIWRVREADLEDFLTGNDQ